MTFYKCYYLLTSPAGLGQRPTRLFRPLHLHCNKDGRIRWWRRPEITVLISVWHKSVWPTGKERWLQEWWEKYEGKPTRAEKAWQSKPWLEELKENRQKKFNIFIKNLFIILLESITIKKNFSTIYIYIYICTCMQRKKKIIFVWSFYLYHLMKIQVIKFVKILTYKSLYTYTSVCVCMCVYIK